MREFQKTFEDVMTEPVQPFLSSCITVFVTLNALFPVLAVISLT